MMSMKHSKGLYNYLNTVERKLKCFFNSIMAAAACYEQLKYYSIIWLIRCYSTPNYFVVEVRFNKSLKDIVKLKTEYINR